jgi:hypothetical protein
LVGRGSRLLVRVGVFDGVDCPDPLPEAYCDLSPEDARELAFGLLAVAEHADRQSRAAGFWRAGRAVSSWPGGMIAVARRRSVQLRLELAENPAPAVALWELVGEQQRQTAMTLLAALIAQTIAGEQERGDGGERQ